MGVFRVYKTKNYTTISNYHLKEKNMSLKAKGLLSVMLSLPEDWDYSIAGLVSISKENETSIKNTLDELKQFRYLEVIKLMPNESKTGRIDYIYNIFEKPKQEGKKQDLENLGVENQDLENQGQLNTNNKYNIIDNINTKDKYNNINIINTKDNTNKEKNNIINNIIKKESKIFKKPTFEEVKNYCIERNNQIDPEYFLDYYDANGWKVGKNPMKDWKATIRTWEKRQNQNKKESNRDVVIYEEV